METDQRRKHFIEMLIKHLCSKGVEITYIPSFIRCVVQELISHPYVSTNELIRQLKLTDWPNIEMDDYIVYLIVGIFEPDCGLTLMKENNVPFILENLRHTIINRADLNVS